MVLRNGISVATQALGICMLLWSATTRSFSHDEMEWWSEFRGMEGWAIAAVTQVDGSFSGCEYNRATLRAMTDQRQAIDITVKCCTERVSVQRLAVTYLQGQLTADIGEIGASVSRSAAWCLARGRGRAVDSRSSTIATKTTLRSPRTTTAPASPSASRSSWAASRPAGVLSPRCAWSTPDAGRATTPPSCVGTWAPFGINQMVFDRTDFPLGDSSIFEFRCTRTHVHDRARIPLVKLISSIVMVCRLQSDSGTLGVHHSDVHRPPPPLPQENQGIEVCRIVFRGLPVVQKIVSVWL